MAAVHFAVESAEKAAQTLPRCDELWALHVITPCCTLLHLAVSILQTNFYV